MDGIINVLKPIGMTSADVVRWMRRKIRSAKVGHIGTLDPGATGVLPICLGTATRLAEYYSDQDKLYRAEITFGIITDTQDAFGREITKASPKVSKADFEKIIEDFIGEIDQVPPMHSAVKKDGKRLYEYARRGLEVSRTKRRIRIEKIELIHWQGGDFPKALFDIKCSKGTYVRTLCHDIGGRLGCGAHMSFLLRLQSGRFSLDSTYTLEEIEDLIKNGDFSFVVNQEWGLTLPRVKIPPDRLKAFKNGLSTVNTRVEGKVLGNREPVQVFCEDVFLGIGIWENGCLKPCKVLG
ncbi:MAG: tRNA pseudouridine(55) synthase TruB [Desulfitobacteriia bacterium]